MGTCYILNFGAILSSEVLEKIEEGFSMKVEQIICSVNVNLQNSIYQQIVSLIDENQYYIDSGCPIVVNTCGLPVAAMIVMVELRSRMGKFPFLIETGRIRKDEPVSSDFKLKRIYDLNSEAKNTEKRFKKDE
jgi:hypothetical protein